MNAALSILVGFLLAVSAQATQSIAMEQDAAQSSDATSESAPDNEPTLDDLDALLGIKDEAPAQVLDEGDDDARDRVDTTELDRALTGREVRDQLVQAIQQMSETADRLTVLKDPGIMTQRLQQEVITKLEQLIKEVEKQSKGQPGQQQEQQKQQQSKQQQNQQQQSDQQQGTESKSAGNGENTPPARRREELRGVLDAASASWGNLPAHYRDGLQQARDQYISELYERLTQAYYRKLAEEATPRQ